MRGTTSWARAVLLAAAAGCFPAAAESLGHRRWARCGMLVEGRRTVAYSDRVGLRNLRPCNGPNSYRANLREPPSRAHHQCGSQAVTAIAWAGIDGVPWAGGTVVQ